MKATVYFVGGLVSAAIGLPSIVYLLDPALRSEAGEAWVPIGKLTDMPEIGKPYPFSFTRVRINGWERTASTHGGFVIRRSEDPNDLLLLNSRCTHLACTVNWKEEEGIFACPCHDAGFDKEGRVTHGPPPRPLDRYENFRITEDGVLEILYKEG